MRTDPVENNLLEYVKRLSKKIRRIDHSETRVDRLSDITDKAGTFSDIEIRANADPSAPKDIGDGFTGAFLSGQGQTFNGEKWGMGTVIDDELQAGLAMDGKIKAGAGAVVLDAAGIEVIATDTAIDLNSYKITDDDGTTIARLSASNNTVGDINTGYVDVDGNANETQASLYLRAIHNDNSTAQIALTTNSGNAVIAETADDITLTATDDITLTATDDINLTGASIRLADATDATAIEVGSGEISINAGGQSLVLNGASLSSDGVIYSGTYTPTLTNTTNIAASTANANTMYIRLGDVVYVWGTVAIDPTATGAIDIGISLPIVSNLSSTQQLGGCASDLYSNACRIFCDTTNDRAQLQGVMTDVSNRAFGFSFGYRII